MTLSPGTRLGPYEILAPLGAGGMGEVYRAKDTRLEREVALKVLPSSTFADATARARLLREARLASQLNHPNVCTIHEVGEVEGRTFIVMELVEGETLSHRLASGRFRSKRSGTSECRWPKRWRTRTATASFTGTSRART